MIAGEIVDKLLALPAAVTRDGDDRLSGLKQREERKSEVQQTLHLFRYASSKT